MARRSEDDRERPLYMISVAAELAGVHPQTLRIYERKQLICPKRSAGNTRLYSDADVERLRLIQHMTQDEGINLAGVERVLAMQRELERMQRELEAVREEMNRIRLRAGASGADVRSVSMVRVQAGRIARRDDRGGAE